MLKIFVPAQNVLFFKNRQIGIWSKKIVLIPCINIVCTSICLKNFLILDNEAPNAFTHWHGTGRMCQLFEQTAT
jgi:hypothetical protein